MKYGYARVSTDEQIWEAWITGRHGSQGVAPSAESPVPTVSDIGA